METEYDNDAGIVQRNADRGAQVIQIDSSKHVAAVTMCAIVCGASVVLSAWSAMTARDTATEYRILLNHTMELEARLKAQENSHERR